MSVICWGNFPIKGKCKNIATRFFISLMKEEPGLHPANRAVCETCYEKYCFAHCFEHGAVKEVEQDKWQEYPGQTKQERS